uniref:Uncharacterized protein n=1 Tax=Schistocephalus solidus TaxID=70667 RepID=A0A0V0J5E0_SCHSO
MPKAFEKGCFPTLLNSTMTRLNSVCCSSPLIQTGIQKIKAGEKEKTDFGTAESEVNIFRAILDSKEDEIAYLSSKLSKIGKRFSDFKKLMYQKLHDAQSSLAKAASNQEELQTLNLKSETEILQLKMMVGTLNRAITEKDILLREMRQIARRFEISFIECGLDQVPQYEKLNQRLNELSDAVSEKDKKIRTLVDEREEYIKLNSLMQKSIQKEEARTANLEKGLDDAKDRIRQLDMENSLLKEDYEFQLKRGCEKENEIKEVKEKLAQQSRTEAEKVRLCVEQAVSGVKNLAQRQLCDAARRLEAAEIALAAQTKQLHCKHEEVIRRNFKDGCQDKATQADENQKLMLISNGTPMKTSLKEISRSESDLRNISISPVRSFGSCKNPDKEFSMTPLMDFTMQADFNHLREKLKKTREHVYQLELNQRLVFAQLVWLASDRKSGLLAHLNGPSKSTKISVRSNPGCGRPTGTVNCSLGVTQVKPKSRPSENVCLCEDEQTIAQPMDQSKIIAQINELLNEKDEKIKQAKEKEFLLKQQILTLRNAKLSEDVTPSDGARTQKSKPKCLSDRLRRAELRLAKVLAETEKWQKCCDEKDSELAAERTHARDLQTTHKADMLNSDL